MADIDEAGAIINDCMYRVEVLERNLRYRAMTNDEREQSTKEVELLKKQLKNHQEQLKNLRYYKPAYTMISVILIIASFLVFGIYHMLRNNN